MVVMHITQNRRRFLAGLSAAGAAGLVGARSPLAAEPPPEVTTLRLSRMRGICVAPAYVADELLRAEGFTDLPRIELEAGLASMEALERGDVDFLVIFAGPLVTAIDAGRPITVIGGVHVGCFELFGHESVRRIVDLRGKKVGVQAVGSTPHVFLSAMATHVGLDPRRDIDWVIGGDVSPMQLFVEREIDAFLGFPPEPQELRGRGIGHVVINSATDRPWSQYFCCLLVGREEFVHQYPVATKRYLRAILKATDLCATEPERMARQLVDEGFTPSYDYALQTLTDVPYDVWRDYDPEDTLRFYALRLHEAGMITSTPGRIISEGSDFRPFEELKRELKA
jgi:NitT/TauT family transport system substrate-binding protein